MSNNSKSFHDPVLGRIVIENEYKYIFELALHPLMQRLHSIKQLGNLQYVFPGASCTRFLHSLGTFEISKRILKQILGSNFATNQTAREVMAAALLHDVGHGPHSHSFERYFDTKHEFYSSQIIRDDKLGISKILNKYGVDPIKVANLINGKHEHVWAAQIISSQLDADRMDYLVRDAYFTGAKYGYIDVDFLVSQMRILNGVIVYDQRVVPSIENYLISRYSMFVQVYEGIKSLGVESLNVAIFKRIHDLSKQNFKFEEDFQLNLLIDFLNKPVLENYTKLNDGTLNDVLWNLNKQKDPVLLNLAKKFRNRNFFVASFPTKDDVEEPYFGWLHQRKNFYVYQTKNAQSIMIDSNGVLRDLTSHSEIINNLADKNVSKQWWISGK